MHKNRIRTKWESLDGRPVRLHVVLPAKPRCWQDALIHPPLLLIPGLGCSVEAWEPVLRCLQQCALDRPVYAMDLPGFGRSPGPRQALSMTELADWVARLMDLLGIARAYVAGHSMGCQVALALARRNPERVAGMVLAGPTEGGDLVPLWRSVLGLLVDGLAEPMLYNGTLPRMYLQMGLPRYLATTRKMQQDDPLASAALVKAPTLVVRGSRDGVVPEMAARRLAAALPNGAFTGIAHSAHAVPFNAPQELTDLALAFWERHEASEAGLTAPTCAAAAASAGEVPLRGTGDDKALPRHSNHSSDDKGSARQKAGVVTVDGWPVHCRLVLPTANGKVPETAAAAAAAQEPGLPILLLHGLAGSGAVWRRALPLFAARGLAVPLYAPDLPGFGQSQGPPQALGMEDLAAWTVRFLDTAGIARAHIAGNSMGCQVALALAHRYPERVGALVLVGPTVGGRGVPLWRYIVGMALNSPREPWPYKALAARMFLQMGPLRYLRTVSKMMTDDALARAPQVSAPTLVVRGCRDGLVPEASARRLAAALANGAFVSVAGAAHTPHYNNAPHFTHLALSFWEDWNRAKQPEAALEAAAVERGA